MTVSGTTQTVGTKVTLASSTFSVPVSIAALSSSGLFISYGQFTTVNVNLGRSKMNVVSISGTTPTFGTSVSIESADVANVAGTWGLLDGAVAPSSSQVIFSTGYNVSEGTVSGATPTYDSSPYSSALSGMYLSTSTKAYTTGGQYLNIVTGGFFATTGGINVIQPTYNLVPVIANPLGAQPTTAFVGYSNSNKNTTILGSTT